MERCTFTKASWKFSDARSLEIIKSNQYVFKIFHQRCHHCQEPSDCWQELWAKKTENQPKLIKVDWWWWFFTQCIYLCTRNNGVGEHYQHFRKSGSWSGRSKTVRHLFVVILITLTIMGCHMCTYCGQQMIWA